MGIKGDDPVSSTTGGWRPQRGAVIVCDMWDDHHCVSAAHRVAHMAPRMNEVLAMLRARGAFIIHSPGDCVDYYAASAARLRAVDARHVDAPVRFAWNGWDPDREAALPLEITTPGPCSCHTPEPCCTGEPRYPWTRQIEGIEISSLDAVSDDGQEVFNLLSARRIDDILVMGVHTNICVLSRPFGIRQLVYLGKRPILCRDLTDSFHRLPGAHEDGTRIVVEHIERYWCPVIRSDELVGGKPFDFTEVRVAEIGPAPP